MYYEYKQWHELFVKVIGIVGGVFTVATILDGAVHSSLYFLIEKQRLGKLKWFYYYVSYNYMQNYSFY